MSDQRDGSEEAIAMTTTVFRNVLGVPIDSEGLEEGCNRMPAALRRSGLITALGARPGGGG